MSRREKVLGVAVDMVNKKEALEIIEKAIEGKNSSGLMHVVTAYSEFFVAAKRDADFRKALAEAELVVPDGVGPLSAIDYIYSIGEDDSCLVRFGKGLVTGTRILRGRVGEPVSGVWLFGELTKLSAKKAWKVLLLGGFGDVAERLTMKLKRQYPELMIKSSPGEQLLGQSEFEEERVLDLVNNFKPDILFVAYGPVKQEKWIALNKKKLAAKVAIGVGGTFDEMTGKVRRAPLVMERMGLKWLWRLIEEPKRFRRMINAYPVFPWMVFREGLLRRGDR